MKSIPIELTSGSRIVSRGAMPLLEIIKLSLRLRAEHSMFGRGRIAHARKMGPGRRHRGATNAPGDKLSRRWYGKTQSALRATKPAPDDLFREYAP